MKMTSRNYSLSDSILFGGLCATAGLTIMFLTYSFTTNPAIYGPAGLVTLLGFHFYVWHT